MWHFFVRDSSKDFPYEIVETLPLKNCASNYSLCKGIRKVDKEVVSIFTFNKKAGSNEEYEVTKHCLKRLKTLRHPSVVAYLDSFENEEYIYIVTEFVEPLLPYLDKLRAVDDIDMYISWGIMSIMKAVSFLNSDGKFCHNNISSSAIFVNEAGEWKLGELGYITELHDAYIKDTKCRLYGPPEVGKLNKPPLKTPWAVDSWGLGILIWEVYNGKVTDPQNLRNLTNIPNTLKSVYCELVATKPESRPNSSEVLQKCSLHGEYFNNILIKTLTFLDEIHLKNKEDVYVFFQELEPILNKLPKQLAQHKVLSQLILAFEYGNEGAYIISPFLKVANNLNDVQYTKIAVPFIVKLYSSNDRATRAKLLQYIDQYIDKVSANTVNDILFPLIVNGFIDTNPLIREKTIKAMVDIASKLNRKNIDDEVLRHLVRLQSKDVQGGIRANTTVCLGKIAPYLNPTNRSAILISTFLRALADGFPPVKNAGVLGFAVCQQYFSLDDVSKKILPSLCTITLDQDPSVRESVFKTIKGFLAKLEKVSENPSLREEMEKEVLSSKTTNIAGTWTDWAVTAISSKFSTKSSDVSLTKCDDQKVLQETEVNSEHQPENKHYSMLNESEEEQEMKSKVDAEDNYSFSAIPISSISDSSSNDESGWDNDFWLNLSDVEKDVKVTPKIESTTKIQDTTTNKAKRNGPMKLGTRLSQQKYD